MVYFSNFNNIVGYSKNKKIILYFVILYIMGDRSSFTQEARKQFNKQHANLLNNKHTTTVKNIQDLQELEKYMFNNLQSLNKSSSNSSQEAELIKKRIDELSAMRLTLFRDLKTMYKDTQKQTHHNRSNLADQITMTKVVENELDNAKKQLKILEQDRLNKKRLAELGEYEYDRYSSHKNIVKVMAYGAVGVLIFAFLSLRKQNFDKTERILKLIKNPKSALVKKQQGFYFYLHGLIQSQKNLTIAEKHFREALKLGLNMSHDVAMAKLSLAGIMMQKRRKREAQSLLTEAKSFDKHNMLTAQIKLMQEQMKRI